MKRRDTQRPSARRATSLRALTITNLDQIVLHSATHLSRPAQLLQDSRDDPRAIVTPVVTPKFFP